MRATLLVLSFVLFTSSCTDDSKNSSSSSTPLIELDTTYPLIDTSLLTIPNENVVVKEEDKISEKYKAFNDIYFTVKRANFLEKSFNSKQELAELDFNVSDEKYDDNYGLYEFTLISENFSELNVVQKNLQRIFSIINNITEDSRELNESSKLGLGGLTKDNFMMMGSGEETISPPRDDGMYYFQKEYFQNGKTIRIGYTSSYTYGKKIKMVTYMGQNGSFKAPEEVGIDTNKLTKHYSIFLLFTCNEIASKITIKKKDKEVIKNYNDANKF